MVLQFGEQPVLNECHLGRVPKFVLNETEMPHRAQWLGLDSKIGGL